VDVAQKLEPGKYIKKPYTLEKIGLAIKEDLAKWVVFGLLLNADLPVVTGLF